MQLDVQNKNMFAEFPKIELHRHLEGTFCFDVLYKIAHQNGIGMPEDFEEFKRETQFPKDSEPDFITFLSKFRNDWYRSFDDVYEITYCSVKTLKKDGIFYIELRFSPEHFSLQNDFDRKEITKLIIDAGNKAAKEIGIHIKYLITFNRSKQNQKEMISLYEKIRDLGLKDIVGIDLAGDELNYKADLFTDFFELVKSDGIYKSTIHAGEVTPAEEIWKAIETLYASRIGHGTAAINDPKLQKYLKDQFIALEQCITSNYQTGSWEDQETHPFGRLFQQGVPVTLNSDDPFIQDTDLTDDYIKATKFFDLTVDDLEKANLTALKASFLTDNEKKSLKEKYLLSVETFRSKYDL